MGVYCAALPLLPDVDCPGVGASIIGKPPDADDGSACEFDLDSVGSTVVGSPCDDMSLCSRRKSFCCWQRTKLLLAVFAGSRLVAAVGGACSAWYRIIRSPRCVLGSARRPPWQKETSAVSFLSPSFFLGERAGPYGSAGVPIARAVVPCSSTRGWPGISVAHVPACGTGTRFVIARSRGFSPAVRTGRSLVGGRRIRILDVGRSLLRRGLGGPRTRSWPTSQLWRSSCRSSSTYPGVYSSRRSCASRAPGCL